MHTTLGVERDPSVSIYARHRTRSFLATRPRFAPPPCRRASRTVLVFREVVSAARLCLSCGPHDNEDAGQTAKSWLLQIGVEEMRTST